MNRILAALLVLVSCAGEPSPATTEVSQHVDLVFNGSFENNYAGWTLSETPTTDTTFGIYAIGSDGAFVDGTTQLFDFADGVTASSGSPGLPLVLDATDGSLVAFNLQNGPQNHRMFQTVTLPACQPLLQWDMYYSNQNATFDPASQYTAVNVRDPGSDAILATPFKTDANSPLRLSVMTPFQVDLSQFSGQTIRLDFEHQVQLFFFDVVYDHVRIVCKGLSASPGTLDFGTVPVGTTTAPQTTTITNFAQTNLTISQLSVTGSYLVTSAPNLPITLPPGGTTSVGLAFRSQVAGPGNGTLTLTSDDPNGPTNVALVATAIDAAVLSVSPPSVAFGDVQVGQTSPPQTVTLSNTGSSPLSITSVQTSPDFVVDTTGMIASLPPGGSTTVKVTFRPAVVGPRNGQLTIQSNDANSPAVVPLSGNGVDAKLVANPPSLAFGNQRVATTSPGQLVRLSNPGTGPVTINSTSISGPFQRTGPALPLTLAPGTFADFTVTFAPTVTGPATGQLAFQTTAPTSPVVTLSGTGVAPAISVNPLSVAFGDVRVGTTATKPVSITNTGSDTLRITSLNALPPFSATAPVPIALAPGGSTTINVTFSPASATISNGTLTIQSDAPTSPTLVSLSGRGVQSQIAVSPTSLAFGNVRVGTTSATKNVTISNPGTTTLNVNPPSATAPFVVVNAAPIAIPPGASATVKVAFAPTATGSATGTVSITSDASPTATIVTCTGTGVAPQITVSPSALAFGEVRTGTTSTGQAVTITNSGTASLTISNLALPGGFTVSAPAVPFGILPGASTTLTVKFAPTVDGPASGNLVITSNAASSPTAVALSGTGVSPRIAVAPSSHDFGDVRVGTSSVPRTFTIQNPGNVTATVTAITVPAPFVATGVPSLPAQLAPGGSLAFDVTFAPTARASIAKAIAVTSDAGTANTPITGRGIAPLIAASPSPASFGTIALGASSSVVVQVSNPGDAPLAVASLSISGANAGDFALAPPPTVPTTLAPGASLAVTVAFTPTGHGTRSAQLAIASDALGTPSKVVGLSGSGSGGQIAVTPSTLDLGASNVTVPSAPKSVVVSNTGEAALTITSIAIGGANAADFATTVALPIVVPPGGSTSVPFVFTPSAVGARTATATLVSDDVLAPTTDVALLGDGDSPVIAVSPTSVAFGDVRVGQSANQQVVVRNTGTGTLSISTVQLSGPDAGQMTLQAVPLPIVLAPGGSRALSVTYTPSVLGSATASLDVLSDDPVNGTIAVPLAGAGVSATLALSTTAIDFGGQLVGRQSAPREVRIQNSGTGPLAVTGLAIGGAQGASFALASPPVLPATVAPGGELAIAVQIAPSVIGAHTANLVITTDSPDSPTASVDLAGLGISTALSVTPVVIEFGATHVPSNTTTVPVTLSNLTSDPITLGDATLGGARPGDFTVTSVAGVVPAGGSVTAMVSYVPAMPATSAATITFAATDATIPQVVIAVSGTAVSSFLVADQPMLALGTIQVGDRSGPRAVTLTNVSTTPVTIASIASTADSFEVDAAGALITLEPGASASFSVAFAPTTTGAITAELRVTLQGQTQPELAIALAGEGSAPPDGGGCSTSHGGAAWWLVLGLLALRRSRR
ncbi:MAG TPA: choice-of-anchor D domain-containing protein [Kofleriaceae bacterium]|nr:choice-of-anchor D domain-containing protein [Kofleriaceae bacterium]